MTPSEQIKLVAERIRDLFGAPDPMEWVAATRDQSAARLRFISDALERIDLDPQDNRASSE